MMMRDVQVRWRLRFECGRVMRWCDASSCCVGGGEKYSLVQMMHTHAYRTSAHHRSVAVWVCEDAMKEKSADSDRLASGGDVEEERPAEAKGDGTEQREDDDRRKRRPWCRSHC